MRFTKTISLIIFLFLFSFSLTAQTDEDIFRIQTISDKVIVLTENSPMENIIVAIASKKGLVVIDATGSRITAKIARKKIIEYFGQDNFIYLINTHQHWDHTWGNQVFSDAVIVGHERCAEYFNKEIVTVSGMTGQVKKNIENRQTKLKNLDPNTDEARLLQNSLAFGKRIYDGLVLDFVPSPPVLLFSDRLNFNLADITLNLIYFGSAHSGSDIFIHIPQERILITGDVFLDKGWLPLFANQEKLDINRWIDVLNSLLAEEIGIKQIIPGHRDIWPKEKLVLWRDYIVNLWEGIQKAKSDGLNLEQVYHNFPLDEKYRYPKKFGHTDAELDSFHIGNINAFWRQLF